MEITNASLSDMPAIFCLYDRATDFQKTQFSVHWPKFETNLIQTEIIENRQWKIIIDGKIACIWATTFNDAQIWQEKNNDPSVYIHRIATNPDFRGQNFVDKIIVWAKNFAFENKKNHIRLDTVGNNQGLINYYTKCGFNFLGLFKLNDTAGLPTHYDNASVCLFEIKLD